MRLGAIATVLLIGACGGAQTATAPSPTPLKAGPLGDTWAWDGGQWHRAATTGPSPRSGASVAYDGRRNVFVLFGGQTQQGPSDETWTWNGRTWTSLSPPHKPPARRLASMAYDPKQQMVVLYGGWVSSGGPEGSEPGDTWTWDGSDWTRVDQGPGPPGTVEGASAVAEGDRVVLFGGIDVLSRRTSSDLFSWDGKAWTKMAAAAQFQARGNATAAWDQAGSSLFIYGGFGYNTQGVIGAQPIPLSDGWSLTNQTWTRLGGQGPDKLALANGLWDQRSHRFVVLLGIECPDPSAKAWAWDGKTWSQLANPGMSARWGAASAQAQDGPALLFGGSNDRGC